jgi:hypothetical protein
MRGMNLGIGLFEGLVWSLLHQGNFCHDWFDRVGEPAVEGICQRRTESVRRIEMVDTYDGGLCCFNKTLSKLV